MSNLPDQTRTEATDETYLRRYRSLAVKARAEGFAGPEQWLRAHASELRPRTVRLYRAAVLGAQQILGLEQSRTELEGLKGGYEGPSRTSARKAKALTDRDFLALIEHVGPTPPGSPRWAALTWLMVAEWTGLRPCEWPGARVEGDSLSIENAKATNGRSHGERRHVSLSALDPDERALLDAWLVYVSEQRDWPARQAAVEKMLRRLNAELWPRRVRRITLYTPRHQFAANLKAAYGKSAVAALLGHAVDYTAGRHYGKSSKAKRWRPLPAPNQEEVQRVRGISSGDGERVIDRPVPSPTQR